VTLEEKKQHNFNISVNYYTLKNNIENQGSSVFVARQPSLEQIQKAATSLPADFYLLSKDKRMLYLLLLLPPQEGKKEYSFLLLNPATGERQSIEAKLKGDITESRAKELLSSGYDTKAQMDGSGKYLLFNGSKLSIIRQRDIEKQLSGIIKGLKTDKAAESQVVLVSKEDLQKIIKEESINNGKLDYWTKLNAQQEKSVGIQVDGFFMQKQHAAVYLWGKAVAQSGVETLEEARELLTSIKGEQSTMHLMHLESGFNKVSSKK
jgi:hypothetical protein